jgi:hypothetical protein
MARTFTLGGNTRKNSDKPEGQPWVVPGIEVRRVEEPDRRTGKMATRHRLLLGARPKGDGCRSTSSYLNVAGDVAVEEVLPQTGTGRVKYVIREASVRQADPNHPNPHPSLVTDRDGNALVKVIYRQTLTGTATIVRMLKGSALVAQELVDEMGYQQEYNDTLVEVRIGGAFVIETSEDFNGNKPCAWLVTYNGERLQYKPYRQRDEALELPTTTVTDGTDNGDGLETESLLVAAAGASTDVSDDDNLLVGDVETGDGGEYDGEEPPTLAAAAATDVNVEDSDDEEGAADPCPEAEGYLPEGPSEDHVDSLVSALGFQDEGEGDGVTSTETVEPVSPAQAPTIAKLTLNIGGATAEVNARPW